jgi:F-type H+-transporting ATPase subunit b
MSRVALPGIASILDQRRKHVDDHLEEAQRLKGEANVAMAAHDKAVAEAHTRAQTFGR